MNGGGWREEVEEAEGCEVDQDGSEEGSERGGQVLEKAVSSKTW